jgi:predicted metalloprotease
VGLPLAAGKGWLEQGDIEEALNAASQIGDDTLQRKSRGTCRARELHPRQQRAAGDLVQARPAVRQRPQQCNTFEARQL